MHAAMVADPVNPSAGDITVLLQRWQEGDRAALEAVAPLLYRELREIAGRRLYGEGAAESLRPTGLVHEAWIRLAGSGGSYASRGQFIACAVLAMRSVLVDHARRQRALRRGGAGRCEELATADGAVGDPRDALLDGLALGEALDRLHAIAPDASAVATLRFLCGHSVEETAAALDVSPGKVKKDWTFARAFLQRELRRGGADAGT
ncbi:MAG: sigma-70 family RNA polymerase sigma factor [Planctomycetes bacterium]|nr:sigma-70 family RNA polymerase sigma factor [Planctomycetota bacterium]